MRRAHGRDAHAHVEAARVLLQRPGVIAEVAHHLSAADDLSRSGIIERAKVCCE